MKYQWGQSLIEVVFAIGVVMLVVSGIASLIINTVGSRTKSYDRKKAVELSQIVMENIIETKNTDATSFWNLNSDYWLDLGATQTDAGYVGYFYSAIPTRFTGNGCSNLITECVNVKINIAWKDNRIISSFNRFFSRK